ncbi:saccharopine dehydrogenase C-terminal domain-containing protein [Glycomyces harbinensis]|uniref:Saccharopine dehydrogenase (NADP+, L-glutamate forming) n=1 Tax=Glycomyces harbinensis TaxID=58114 RepID=A0A1G6ZM46_9ACTN|nr:saccharopine dehydrogenase C-terminal domain-containing protein [Glycomyces harbinensis]SDE02875.1 saccharopine dehydrogenase (NADP+, L-glutamate forming) [Glycomyces harbinensis]
MSDRIAPTTGTVHWIGTGLSTGRTGLTVLGRAADVVLWGRTRDRARTRLDALGVAAPITVRGLDTDDLADALEPGDVLVSMLPAAHHPRLLRTAIDAGAHFACTSYTSPEIAALADEAAALGLAVLTEAGLDPGIDHLMAHLLLDRARQHLGDGPVRYSLASHCGGIPDEPGEFRYQFSWAPMGVLTALASPARYVEGGTVRETPRPWEGCEDYLLDGEAFEVYPNRDSTEFIAQYGFPDDWTAESFVRGTLRPQGWKRAWKSVFDVVDSGDRDRLAALADELAERYPTTPDDRDRVVLAVSLDARRDGAHWRGRYTLDVTGDDADTAMARCVATSLACGLAPILDRTAGPGLHRAAADTAAARRWLDRLAAEGLPWTHHSTDQEGQR